MRHFILAEPQEDEMAKPENFQMRVRRHLAEYRSEDMGVQQLGEWRGRPYPHILPRSNYRDNLLPSIREEFWTSSFSRIKLHRDFSHLNSLRVRSSAGGRIETALIEFQRKYICQ